jgi:7-carboxy-7-deazaguanine synthase
MPITLIQSNTPKTSDGNWACNEFDSLQVSEFFCDTIQGEGVSTGVPSTFLRLKGCTLDCVWCDTAAVWKAGDSYHFIELFLMMSKVGLIERFQNGQHLILTGGSPLKQQDRLINFIDQFISTYGFKPYIEIENECVLMPNDRLIRDITQWNNSPKLANSGMKERARYKPEVIAKTASLPNSWFKFVVETESDWQEIKDHFITTNLIRKDQIILMPCGENQGMLDISRPIAADMAIKHGVRFCDRLHVTIWDKKTGV